MNGVFILAQTSTPWWVWVIIALCFIGCLFMVVSGLQDASEKAKKIGEAVLDKVSDWENEREEKKEIERLQRQVLKKQLEDELKKSD